MKRIVLVFLLFIACKSEWDKLPVLSYTINDDGQKEVYRITYPEGFLNQRGEPFTHEAINGKVFIANFFFTRCPSICPPMRQRLISISNKIEHKDFLMVSHSIDPTNDTPEILMAYGEATGIPSSRWQFVTASENITKDQAKSFQTNFKPFEDGTDFYHSSYVALVDRENLIRGFYDLLKPREVELLKLDIMLLLD